MGVPAGPPAWHQGWEIALSLKIAHIKAQLRVICSCRSLKKSEPRANRYHRSSQKSNHERLAPVAHDKKVTGAIRSFSRVIRSFAHKKGAIYLKTDERSPNPAWHTSWGSSGASHH